MRTIHLISIIVILTILSACNKSNELPVVNDIQENNEVDQMEDIEENNELEQSENSEEDGETEQVEEAYVFDCTFVQNEETADGWFNETESKIITECDKNQLTTVENIKQNLIGEWELVGHAVGWALPISLPCAHIEITENELIFTFEDQTKNTVTNHTWSIEEGTRYGKEVLVLNVEPKTIALSAHSFCELYMYQDYTPQDGNMYLYQKMK